MSEAVVIGLIAAVPATVAAFASWRNGRKVDKTAGQIAEIHVLTNSNLTKVTVKLEQATRQIAELQKLVADLIAERDGHDA